MTTETKGYNLPALNIKIKELTDETAISMIVFQNMYIADFGKMPEKNKEYKDFLTVCSSHVDFTGIPSK